MEEETVFDCVLLAVAVLVGGGVNVAVVDNDEENVILDERVCEGVGVGGGVTVVDWVPEKLLLRVAVEVGAGVMVLELVTVDDGEGPDNDCVTEIVGVGGGVTVTVWLRLRVLEVDPVTERVPVTVGGVVTVALRLDENEAVLVSVAVGGGVRVAELVSDSESVVDSVIDRVGVDVGGGVIVEERDDVSVGGGVKVCEIERDMVGGGVKVVVGVSDGKVSVTLCDKDGVDVTVGGGVTVAVRETVVVGGGVMVNDFDVVGVGAAVTVRVVEKVPDGKVADEVFVPVSVSLGDNEAVRGKVFVFEKVTVAVGGGVIVKVRDIFVTVTDTVTEGEFV